MKKFWLMICASVLFAACGGTTSTNSVSSSTPTNATPKLEVKVDGKGYSFEIKDGVGNNDTVRATDRKTGKSELMAQHRFYLTTYAIDDDVHKTLTKNGDTRVMIEINSEAGTNKETSLPKVGTYPVGDDENSFHAVNFYTFEYGKEKIIFSSSINNVTRKGEVKITSVEGKIVKGDVDVAIGDKLSVKGAFTAKFRL